MALSQIDFFAQKRHGLVNLIHTWLLVGGSLPFFGSVVGNMIGLVKELGNNGLVGLIALGVILWLFSKRSVT